MKNDIKGSVRILSFLKNDIKVFSAIYGDNWQSLNILTTGETFAQNIIVYLMTTKHSKFILYKNRLFGTYKFI